MLSASNGPKWNEELVADLENAEVRDCLDYMAGLFSTKTDMMNPVSMMPTARGYAFGKAAERLARLGAKVLLARNSLIPLLRNCDANDDDTILETLKD